MTSFLIALFTTGLTTLVTVPLAHLMTRFSFPRQGPLLSGLLLVPMIMRRSSGRSVFRGATAGQVGSVNLLLMTRSSPGRAVSWLEWGGFWGIVVLRLLENLYPIMFLNVSAAMANVDPASLREAAQNLGATGWRLFRTVTLPLILARLLCRGHHRYIWAFTDLGTPLIFGFSRVVPVQIFDAVSLRPQHTNPMGHTPRRLRAGAPAGAETVPDRASDFRRPASGTEMIARKGTPARLENAGQRPPGHPAFTEQCAGALIAVGAAAASGGDRAVLFWSAG